MRYFLALVLCLLSSAAFGDEFVKFDIVRFFMHNVGKYSYAVEDDNNEIVIKYLDVINDNVRIYKDVPADKSMYIRAIQPTWFLAPKGRFLKTEIHLHSEKDINGAGWDNGKHGSGNTVVVE